MSRLDAGYLALRQEGGFWNAYYVPPGKPASEGVLLGSISMSFVGRPDGPRATAFGAVMQDVVSDLIEQATGVRPVWDKPQRAPESERSGNA